MAQQKSQAMRFLERITGGPLTFAECIRSIREGEEMSGAAFARSLGITPQKLSDIERGRRSVSVERAAKWAEQLGYPPEQFVKLVLQAELDAVADHRFSVEVIRLPQAERGVAKAAGLNRPPKRARALKPARSA